MDRQYIDDHHIVARYLADQLSDREREAFELYFLDHPDIVKDLEAAARFKTGLLQLQDTGELADLMAARPWYRQQRFAGYAATLAAVLFGVYSIAPSLMTSGVRPASPLLAPSLSELRSVRGERLAVAGSYQILRTRGRPVDAAIELPAAAAAIELRILPEFEAQPAHYRIVLSRTNEEGTMAIVGETDGLVPARDGFVTAFVDSRRLQPGEYELVLWGDRDTDARDVNSMFTLGVRGR